MKLFHIKPVTRLQDHSIGRAVFTFMNGSFLSHFAGFNCNSFMRILKFITLILPLYLPNEHNLKHIIMWINSSLVKYCMISNFNFKNSKSFLLCIYSQHSHYLLFVFYDRKLAIVDMYRYINLHSVYFYLYIIRLLIAHGGRYRDQNNGRRSK